MSRTWFLRFATVLVACLVGPAIAGDRLGIVLLHGKQGLPVQLKPLADDLAAAGHLTERPLMCWSRTRIYDRTYLDCLSDIDQAATSLKQKGAAGIVVVGMSLGGNAAIAYGARRDGLTGIAALAPAPALEFIVNRPPIDKSLDVARGLIAAGQGERQQAFEDLNMGRAFEVRTSAEIFASFFGADAVMSDNAARLKAPLLIVTGTFDPTQRSVPNLFARAPPHPLNQYVTVNADHLDTPRAGRDAVLAWVKRLSER
jgi:esterase/lipase